MKIRVLSVGRPRDDAFAHKVEDYGARVRRFGIAWEVAFVPEERPDGRYSDEHVREREARALGLALSGRGVVIALDEGGTLWSSEALARRVERWIRPEATFVLGGPLGLHRSIVDAADARWSLSPLTLPHELARVLVAEQLYRALTIARNVPYHKA